MNLVYCFNSEKQATRMFAKLRRVSFRGLSLPKNSFLVEGKKIVFVGETNEFSLCAEVHGFIRGYLAGKKEKTFDSPKSKLVRKDS